MVTDNLLSRVVRNMRAGIPVEDIREACLQSGEKEEDVYLAVKGAQILLKSEEHSVTM